MSHFKTASFMKLDYWRSDSSAISFNPLHIIGQTVFLKPGNFLRPSTRHMDNQFLAQDNSPDLYIGAFRKLECPSARHPGKL